MTVAINIGAALSDAAPALLDLEELLATRLLVQGNSGSGKSHLLRRLLEQSAEHVQQLVIDPEGDFVTLADRYGHVVVDGSRSLADLECIAQRVRQHRVSTVLSLERLDAEQQMRAAAHFLNTLFEADRDFWFPMLVVVDEAQLFAPAVSGDVAEDVRKLSLGAMTNLMCRGRKRGLAGVIATQRLAKLAKNVAAEATNFLMGRTFLDIDMARAADLLGLERRQAEMFRDLQRGHFVALGPALSKRPLPVRVGTVETAPRAATPTLLPMPDQPDEAVRDLILAPMPVEARRDARERRETAPSSPSMNQILEQIVRDRPSPSIEAALDTVDPGEREVAYRAILQAIVADAAYRADSLLYQDFCVRCRIQRLIAPPLPAFRVLLNEARASIEPEIAQGESWRNVLAVVRDIPEDLQGVYLILAAAALQNRPCPSDAEIARRCGQHAPGRARSRIRHLEKAERIVVRSGLSGARAVVVTDLGWETGWGDASGPDTAVAQIAAE